MKITQKNLSIILLVFMLVSLLPTSSAFALAQQPKIDGEPEAMSAREFVDTLEHPRTPIDVNTDKFHPDETYACTWINQQPADYIEMKPRQSFDMTWVVQNTGDAVWHASESSYAYYSGVAMYTKSAAYALPADVGKGEKLRMTIDLEAPKSPGVYSTTWAVLTGNTRVCRMFLILVVK